MNLDVNFQECHMWEGTFLRHQGSHLAVKQNQKALCHCSSWQKSEVTKNLFFQCEKQELGLMYKMTTPRKRPSRESAFSMAESFSLGKPHNCQIQLRGTPWPGRGAVSGVATFGGLASPPSEGVLCFCYCFSFCSPPASQEPLTAAWGDFKHCWANLLFFWMVGLFNVFEGGGPGFFVLGVYTSSWPGGIFRARGCEGASSVNPSHFILLEMVPVGGFPTFWPFENLYLLGTVVTLLSQVWLGLTGHRPIISGLLAIATCHNKLSSFWPPWGTAEAAAFIHSGQKEQGWTVTQGEII